MKYNQIAIFLLCVTAVFMFSSGFAQKRVVLSGTVKGGKGFDTLVVYKYDNEALVKSYKFARVFRIPVDNGKFSFVMRMDEPFTYLEVKEKFATSFENLPQKMLIMDNDSLNFLITATKASVSGIGARRVLIQKEMEGIQGIPEESWYTLDYQVLLDNHLKAVQLGRKKSGFAGKNAASIGKAALSVMELENEYAARYKVVQNLYRLVRTNPGKTELHAVVRDFFEDSILNSRIPKQMMEGAENSMYLPQYLFSRILLQSMLYGKMNSWYKDIFHLISEVENKKLREVLLLKLLSNTDLNDLTDSTDVYRQRADAMVTSYKNRPPLQYFLGASFPGATPRNFSFYDSAGNKVKLRDFKGKVVFIDIWHTGCGMCAVMNERLKPVMDSLFRVNKDFVLLSISTDKKADVWKKSLKTFEYHHEKAIALNDHFMGEDSPLYKFYGFEGAPQTILLDKNGNLVAMNPPVKPKYNPEFHLLGLLNKLL
ncbi:MAG: redoxin family protein [Pseudobacter sp.]|uniref:redoxin family protein n=1 Tax=Pseudobacter sp. TaxID=2045420 RepID=UPI003F7E15DB